jgi:peptide/nickel transport system permease protein
LNWPRFIAQRLLLIAMSLVILSALIFALMEVIPGDIAQTILGRGATAQQIRDLHIQLGLDQPAYLRYARWLRGIASGDFGESISLHAAIGPLLVQRGLNSLLLAALAGSIGLSTSIVLGFLAGLRRPAWLDPLVSRGAVTVGSLPEFLVAMILIVVFASWLGWLPATSYSGSGSPLRNPVGLVLPALTLIIVMAAYNLRITRASVARVADSEFVIAAELKRLPLRTIVRRHIAPNALLPSITVAAAYLGWMVGGLVVIESVFAYPGIGLLILSAAQTRDVPLLEGAVILIASFRMLINFSADLLYMVVDPRVRLA